MDFLRRLDPSQSFTGGSPYSISVEGDNIPFYISDVVISTTPSYDISGGNRLVDMMGSQQMTIKGYLTDGDLSRTSGWEKNKPEKKKKPTPILDRFSIMDMD